MLNIEQTKLVGLTMELELKAKEYKVLCNELDKLKAEKIDPNDKKLIKLKKLFQKNHDEIQEIKNKIKDIKSQE